MRSRAGRLLAGGLAFASLIVPAQGQRELALKSFEIAAKLGPRAMHSGAWDRTDA